MPRTEQVGDHLWRTVNWTASQSAVVRPTQGVRTRSSINNKTGFDWSIDWLIDCLIITSISTAISNVSTLHCWHPSYFMFSDEDGVQMTGFPTGGGIYAKRRERLAQIHTWQAAVRVPCDQHAAKGIVFPCFAVFLALLRGSPSVAVMFPGARPFCRLTVCVCVCVCACVLN